MAGQQLSLVTRYALSPERIEAESLRRVDEVLRSHGRWVGPDLEVARRLVYAAGDLTLGGLLRIHQEAVTAAVTALRGASPIVVDVRMVEVALDRSLLSQLGCEVHCAIDRPEVIAQAAEQGLPRAVLAMRALAPQLGGALAVVGTAPTALLSLLDLVDAGQAVPAAIVGTPVGLLIASEAKAELAARGVPYVTIEGTRGGAALAAAATNALLRLAVEG